MESADAPGCMPPAPEIAVFICRPSRSALAKAPTVLIFRKQHEESYSGDRDLRVRRLAHQAKIDGKEVPKSSNHECNRQREACVFIVGAGGSTYR
jgi:hypothetical protein